MQTAATNSAQRARSWTGTPEVYFHKVIDNSVVEQLLQEKFIQKQFGKEFR